MDITEKIAEHIASISQQRRELAESIRTSSPSLISKIQSQKLDGLKICGVDGGFLRKDFHGLTLIIRRAVGVCFTYSKNRVSAEYLPLKNPTPEPFILPTEFSAEDVNIMANLKRVEIEIKTALDCVKKFSPDILILDGSVVLHPSSIPKKDSAAYIMYKEVITLMRELYDYCANYQIILAGACEDSKGRKFCNVLANQLFSGKPEAKILKTSNDTTFLHYLLKNE